MMSLSGLKKSFGATQSIREFSLEIGGDEYLTLLGPSGSGKTTLLRMIAGLDQPDAGSISIDGDDITHKPTHQRGLGFVQQNYALFPHMSVEDNVSFGLINREENPIRDKKEVKRLSNEILELVGLSDLGTRMVGQLSGGQKQRVSLARTLVTRPRLCLLDEPLGALDANLRARMMVELRRIRETLGVTFLHVTGNEEEALAMGDRMIVLNQGEVIQIDAPDKIFIRPATVDVASILNNYNIFSGHIQDGMFQCGNDQLKLPVGMDNAEYYAIGYDQLEFVDPEAEIAPQCAVLAATFKASEFMGSNVTYFFETTAGQLIEVQRHISLEVPRTLQTGTLKHIIWQPQNGQFYDGDGKHIYKISGNQNIQ